MNTVEIRIVKIRKNNDRIRNQYVPGYYRAKPVPIDESEMTDDQQQCLQMMIDLNEKANQDNA